MLAAMATLDYAYLAEYVGLQEGKLNAIGASFTFARTAAIPGVMGVGVAGRVRATTDEGPVSIEIRAVAPNEAYTLEYNGVITAGDQIRPYRANTVGLLFALNLQLPLTSAGLYEILISLNGEQVRRLAFELEVPSGS